MLKDLFKLMVSKFIVRTSIDLISSVVFGGVASEADFTSIYNLITVYLIKTCFPTLIVTLT